MKSRKVFQALLSLFSIGVGITAGDALQPPVQAFFLSEGEQAWVRDGIKLEIRGVEFNPPTVSFTFRIADEEGRGLDRLGVDTPGPVDFSFLLARIKPGDLQYTNYITERVTSPTTGVTVERPPAQGDSGGTYASLGDGVYKFTFDDSVILYNNVLT